MMKLQPTLMDNSQPFLVCMHCYSSYKTLRPKRETEAKETGNSFLSDSLFYHIVLELDFHPAALYSLLWKYVYLLYVCRDSNALGAGFEINVPVHASNKGEASQLVV